MDISYLLFLQNFRETSGGFLTDFFSKMTFLGELNTVIAPESKALSTATGYSFPSGHSMNAASVFGGGVVRKDLPKVLRITACITAVLVAFSRNFLGVHTPQDVLVGIGAGLLVMWLCYILMGWIERNPEKDWMVVCIGVVLAIAVAVYAKFKPYPEDFDAAGKLIVDGAKMANDTFKGVGYFIAVLTGWILERRLVRFSTDELSLSRKLTRVLTGLLTYYAVSLIVCPLIKNGLAGPVGTLLSCFLQVFYVVFLFPWCLKRLEKTV